MTANVSSVATPAYRVPHGDTHRYEMAEFGRENLSRFTIGRATDSPPGGAPGLRTHMERRHPPLDFAASLADSQPLTHPDENDMGIKTVSYCEPMTYGFLAA